jgi:hypothetical protein
MRPYARRTQKGVRLGKVQGRSTYQPCGCDLIVIGIFVAWDHNYFDNVDTLKEVLSAAFAIALWPLVVVGVNQRIRKEIEAENSSG